MILIDQRRSIKIMKISVLSSPGIRRESAGNPPGIRALFAWVCGP
jgi:hypothetical protein